MVLLDPFYGVFKTGKTVARWMNRILLLGESYFIFSIVRFHIVYRLLETWHWFIFIPAIILALHVTNLLIRWIWNVVVVIYYGTTDAETIVEQHQRRQDRRMAARKKAEELRRREEDNYRVSPDVIKEFDIRPDSD